MTSLKHKMTLADLTAAQVSTLRTYQDLLWGFNQKINMISRDVTRDQLWERHVLHSLALTARTFPHGTVMADWGTGGGLPAIPVAIVLPNITVFGVDAVGKKIQTVRAMARRLGLGNLRAVHTRAEQFTTPIHYSISRATAPLAMLWQWHARVAIPFEGQLTEDHWRPGLICLKGGDLTAEIEDLHRAFAGLVVEQHLLPDFLNAPYFDEKGIIAVYRGRAT